VSFFGEPVVGLYDSVTRLLQAKRVGGAVLCDYHRGTEDTEAHRGKNLFGGLVAIILVVVYSEMLLLFSVFLCALRVSVVDEKNKAHTNQYNVILIAPTNHPVLIQKISQWLIA
jgi:hypothetical protein